jgi:hypothetical protein
VPHPHLRQDTERFRNQQDSINRFLHSYLVKCSDPERGGPIEEIIEKYSKWYSSRYPDDRTFKKWIYNNIENSLINKYLVKNERGLTYLRGWRILDAAESKEDNEEYYCNIADEKDKEYIVKLPKETSEQCYDRLCKEYDRCLQEQAEKHKTAINTVKNKKDPQHLTREEINNIIRLDDVTKLKENEKYHIAGSLVEATFIKSRSNRPNQTATFVYDYDHGFDPILSLYLFLNERGRVNGSGVGMYLDDYNEFKFSMGNLKDKLAGNPEFYKIFQDIALDELSKIPKVQKDDEEMERNMTDEMLNMYQNLRPTSNN